MLNKDIDTKTTTVISLIAPTKSEHSPFYSIQIQFADDFDLSVLPNSVRARKFMNIDCTPRDGNAKNEAGLKRYARIKKALEGTNVEFSCDYSNSVSEEEFLSCFA